MTDGENPQSQRDVTKPRANALARWVCGYTRLGVACETGPSRDGTCCQLQKRSDNPTAASPSEQHEQCDQACSCATVCELSKLRRKPALPSHLDMGPCQPQKSAWFARQSLALNAAILIGGILLLCMALPVREQVFVPGELSRKHSQILGNRLVSDRCSLCHPSSHSIDGLPQTQDALCMNCHQSHMPHAHRRTPHDLQPQQITLLGASGSQGRMLASSKSAETKTRCAQCHIEHHGSDHNLQAITSARCQACHQRQFSSFAESHPQFVGFPYRTARRIKFNHSTHAQQHFAKSGDTFSCRDCHTGSDRATISGVARVVDFEQACAKCHQEPINAAVTSGLALLQLPSLEESDVQSGAPELKDWPTDALFGYDGEVSRAMVYLLSADEGFERVVRHIPENGQLAKVPDEQRAATARSVAIALRRLVEDVAADGQTAWEKRLLSVLEKRLGRPANAGEQRLIDELCSGLPPDLFRTIRSQWFGGDVQLAAIEFSQVTGRLVSGQQTTPQLKTEQSDQSDGDDLLEFDTLLSKEIDAPENLGMEDSSATLDEHSNGHSPAVKLTKLQGAAHLSGGGWYLDPELYVLRYMPRGHADRTLAAWAEYANLLSSHGESAVATKSPSSKMLASCYECHALDSAAIEPLTWSAWKAKSRPAQVKQFTKFNHEPHLTLPVVNGCQYCHQVQPFESGGPASTIMVTSRENHETIESRGTPLPTHPPLAGPNDFAPMQREQCSACHRAGAASDACTTCHNYHVGDEGLDWSSSGLQLSASKVREILTEVGGVDPIVAKRLGPVKR